MGRLTKEMKKAELMEQLTETNETYLEKISQHMECQYREMQRVERRIERKKKLIDKKYIVSMPCGWTMTAPWWMSFPPLSKTWWNMISLS